MTPLQVISLGWGVQSFTLAAMVALEELPPVTAAVHADTTHERQGTYEFARAWTPWLEARGVRVVTVTDKSVNEIGNLIPVYTLVPPGFSGAVWRETGYAGDLDSGERTDGQVRRQCTGRWKIDPIHRWMRAELARRGMLQPPPGAVVQWIGISHDEFHRAKTSAVQYIVQRFPLLEQRMTRGDCITWLQAHHLPVPPKSACVFCPYHNKGAWEALKRAGGRDWDYAVAVDARIRDQRPPLPAFVNRKRLPLPEAVVISEDQGYSQADLFARPDEEDAPCDNGGCFI